MPEAALIPAGEGEVVGDTQDRRVEILCEHDALHATWSRFAAGRDGADLHVHHHHTDLFYVVEGQLTMRLGPEGHPVPLPARTLVRVPPLVVHGFRNGSGEEEVRYLNLHAPGRGFADFLRGRNPSFDQHDPPADGGRDPAGAVIGEEVADVEEIGVADLRLEPGAEAAAHVHRRHAESLYVLEGELAVTAGGRELRAGPGAWVQLPAGVPHRVAAAGAGAARYLDLHAPSFGLGAEDEEPA